MNRSSIVIFLLIFIVISISITIITTDDNYNVVIKKIHYEYFKTKSKPTFNLEFLNTQKKLKPFPFRFFKDENNNILPIVAVTGFFRKKEDKILFEQFQKEGIIIIGITAYRTFPKEINDKPEDKFHLTDDFDYINRIETWLSCMKNPEHYGLSKDKHKLLEMSESDFYDVESTQEYTEKKYDFIYICNKDNDKCPLDGWNAIVRNYKLALDCFPILFNEFKLKGLLVGRIGCGLEEIYGDQVETTDFLDYFKLQEKMKQSRFLFLPNISDQSPRVVSEMLIKNNPILMNRNIVCGFKYINNDTGEFFTDVDDFRSSLKSLLERIPTMKPAEWWKLNHSKKINGKRLKDFLTNIYPEYLENVKEVSMYI